MAHCAWATSALLGASALWSNWTNIAGFEHSTAKMEQATIISLIWFARCRLSLCNAEELSLQHYPSDVGGKSWSCCPLLSCALGWLPSPGLPGGAGCSDSPGAGGRWPCPLKNGLCAATTPTMSVLAVAVPVVTLQSGFPIWLHFCSDWGHMPSNTSSKLRQWEVARDGFAEVRGN